MMFIKNGMKIKGEIIILIKIKIFLKKTMMNRIIFALIKKDNKF